MNSKAEDFPTPVSPIRRIVYGVFALFFDVLTIALLMDSTSLGNGVRTIALKIASCLLDNRGATPVIHFQRVLAWVSRNVIVGNSVT